MAKQKPVEVQPAVKTDVKPTPNPAELLSEAAGQLQIAVQSMAAFKDLRRALDSQPGEEPAVFGLLSTDVIGCRNVPVVMLSPSANSGKLITAFVNAYFKNLLLDVQNASVKLKQLEAILIKTITPNSGVYVPTDDPAPEVAEDDAEDLYAQEK